MDNWRSGLSLKPLVVNESRATEQTNRSAAAVRCHRVDCSLYAQLINIGFLFPNARRFHHASCFL